MENEENRDLINEKASEDQFIDFCKFSFGALSLSYSWTLIFSWNTLGGCGIIGFLEQEGKGKAGKHKGTLGSVDTMDFTCRYQVACMFSSLVLAYMAYPCGLLVMICHWHGGLLGFSQPFHFLGSHHIVGYFSLIFLVGSNVFYSLG